jgi:hypothetical protein
MSVPKYINILFRAPDKLRICVFYAMKTSENGTAPQEKSITFVGDGMYMYYTCCQISTRNCLVKSYYGPPTLRSYDNWFLIFTSNYRFSIYMTNCLYYWVPISLSADLSFKPSANLSCTRQRWHCNLVWMDNLRVTKKRGVWGLKICLEKDQRMTTPNNFVEDGMYMYYTCCQISTRNCLVKSYYGPPTLRSYDNWFLILWWYERS